MFCVQADTPYCSSVRWSAIEHDALTWLTMFLGYTQRYIQVSNNKICTVGVPNNVIRSIASISAVVTPKKKKQCCQRRVQKIQFFFC